MSSAFGISTRELRVNLYFFARSHIRVGTRQQNYATVSILYRFLYLFEHHLGKDAHPFLYSQKIIIE